MPMVNGYGPLGVLGIIPSPPPAMPSTPKVPNVTMTMSKQVHSYARNKGAQNRQAREAEESDCK